MRTTLDLEEPILEELKLLQREEGVSLGKLASRLIADALSSRRKKKSKTERLHWTSHRMNALVDISDKDALYKILDRE
ncbi:MAG: antitoxin [bacterium]